MEENKDYQVYRFDYLTEGSQLKLDHSVYCEDVDISSLITQSADALEALRQDSEYFHAWEPSVSRLRAIKKFLPSEPLLPQDIVKGLCQ